MSNKKDSIKYYFFTFIIIVIFIFIFGVFYLRSLEIKIEEFVGHYGYPLVLLFSFLSEATIQPIGPDLVIITGVISGLNHFLVFFIASLGSILASFLDFWLGKRYGKIGFTRLFGKKKFEKYGKPYKKYGKYGLLISSLTPVPYVLFCWVSGIFNMKIRQFIYFGVIPRILRFLVVALIASLF